MARTETEAAAAVAEREQQLQQLTLDQLKEAYELTRSAAEAVAEDLGELAAQVTAGAGSDYDKLLALQSWFRSPEFAYSLDAPVEDGFDVVAVDVAHERAVVVVVILGPQPRSVQ